MDWARAWNEIVELVYPPRCAVCEELGRPALCPACREGVEHLEPPWCACCGRPLMPTAVHAMLCGECRAEPPRFTAARAVGLHTGPLRQAVLRFKFRRRRELVEPLGELLAQRLAAQQAEPGGGDWESLEAVVPVALHPRRRAWRGFDQAVLLGREVARRSGREYRPQALVRIRHTHAQIGLSLAQRRDNLRGAFAVPDSDRVVGHSLLLVDDVYTTGATLQAAARALRRAGARQVYALTLTRALPLWRLDKLIALGDERDADPRP